MAVHSTESSTSDSFDVRPTTTMTNIEESGIVNVDIEADPGTSAMTDKTPATSTRGEEHDDAGNKTNKTENKKSRTKKSEINKDFEDVQETGKWGSVSKKEVYIAVCFVIAVIIGIAAAVVVVIANNNGDNNDGETSSSSSDDGEAVALLNEQEQLDLIRSALKDSVVMAKYVDVIPSDIASLDGKYEDDSTDPLLRAASWIVTKDVINERNQIVERFALAAVYYSNGGENWTKSTLWLSDRSICDGWYGVDSCEFTTYGVTDLDLENNNLAGEIPDVLSLLTTLRTLWLSENSLHGEINPAVFSNLPRLTMLYIHENNLSGEIPPSLLSNGVLETLFLQYNNFTGDFPDTFCPECPGCVHPLTHFGLTCSQTLCPPGCCNTFNNCFE